MANASGIQDAKGPISLRSALLRVQRTIGGATQRPICLQGKSGTGKASGKRRTCPLGRSILNLRRLLFRARRLDGGSRLENHCWGKFRCAQLRGGELLPEFQAQVPHPLGEDLAKLLTTRGMGVPPVRVLLHIFIGEHRLKRAAMQVQIKHIRAGKSRRGKRADKQLVDGAVALDANFEGRGGGAMGGDHQAHLGSGWRQRDSQAIVEFTRHSTFWVDAHLIRGTRQCLLDDFQIQQTVVTTREAITPRTSMSGAASP